MNRYIYHYNAINGNVSVAGIAQLTFRIASQADLEKLKSVVNMDGFTANAITSLSFLGMEYENDPVIPEGSIIVPRDLLEELRDWAFPRIEDYCDMWKGRRDDEFPALRKLLSDADDLLAAPHLPVAPDIDVTAEHRRVIEMLLRLHKAAFELAEDCCAQEIHGEECCHVTMDAFNKLSAALDELDETLLTTDPDRPDVYLAGAAMPQAALKMLLQSGSKS